MRELDVLNVRYARIWCPLPTVGRHPHDLLRVAEVVGIEPTRPFRPTRFPSEPLTTWVHFQVGASAEGSSAR